MKVKVKEWYVIFLSEISTNLATGNLGKYYKLQVRQEKDKEKWDKLVNTIHAINLVMSLV